jgi:SAM-dependent methyltransferase
MLDRVRHLGQSLLKPQTRERLDAWWHGVEAEEHGVSVEGAPLAGTPSVVVDPGSSIVQRVRVAEALWGHGNFGPGDAEFLTMLAAQLGLTKEMSLAVIGVGLGGAARALVDDTEVWITGIEGNATVAALGIEQCTLAGKAKKVEISAADYETLSLPARKFNDVISKETLYLVRDKARLIAQIAGGMKPGGTFIFTDYVTPQGPLSAEECDQLFARELGEPLPIAPGDYASPMGAAGFDLRVNEDISAAFGEYITQGWTNLRRMLDQLAANEENPAERALFMRIVAEEASHWANRLEAFRTGRLAVYRFVALKARDVG